MLADILTSPHSFRALVKQDRVKEARDVIDMLSLEADPVKRAEATVCILLTDLLRHKLIISQIMSMSLIETALLEEAESSSSWSDITTQGRPRFLQRLVLAILPLVMMQLSGINLITYYA